MGYNRSGTRRKQKEKRFKREIQRMVAKLAKEKPAVADAKAQPAVADAKAQPAVAAK